MTTSWTTSGNDTQTWTTQVGVGSILGGADSVSSVTQDTFLPDNQKIYFGSDLDFSMSFNSTTNRLEFLDNLGNQVLQLDSSGILGGISGTDLNINSMTFGEKTSLPPAVEGQMIFVNDLYYLGF